MGSKGKGGEKGENRGKRGNKKSGPEPKHVDKKQTSSKKAGNNSSIFQKPSDVVENPTKDAACAEAKVTNLLKATDHKNAGEAGAIGGGDVESTDSGDGMGAPVSESASARKKRKRALRAARKLGAAQETVESSSAEESAKVGGAGTSGKSETSTRPAGDHSATQKEEESAPVGKKRKKGSNTKSCNELCTREEPSCDKTVGVLAGDKTQTEPVQELHKAKKNKKSSKMKDGQESSGGKQVLPEQKIIPSSIVKDSDKTLQDPTLAKNRKRAKENSSQEDRETQIKKMEVGNDNKNLQTNLSDTTGTVSGLESENIKNKKLKKKKTKDSSVEVEIKSDPFQKKVDTQKIIPGTYQNPIISTAKKKMKECNMKTSPTLPVLEEVPSEQEINSENTSETIASENQDLNINKKKKKKKQKRSKMKEMDEEISKNSENTENVVSDQKNTPSTTDNQTKSDVIQEECKEITPDVNVTCENSEEALTTKSVISDETISVTNEYSISVPKEEKDRFADSDEGHKIKTDMEKEVQILTSLPVHITACGEIQQESSTIKEEQETKSEPSIESSVDTKLQLEMDIKSQNVTENITEILPVQDSTTSDVDEASKTSETETEQSKALDDKQETRSDNTCTDKAHEEMTNSCPVETKSAGTERPSVPSVEMSQQDPEQAKTGTGARVADIFPIGDSCVINIDQILTTVSNLVNEASTAETSSSEDETDTNGNDIHDPNFIEEEEHESEISRGMCDNLLEMAASEGDSGQARGVVTVPTITVTTEDDVAEGETPSEGETAAETSESTSHQQSQNEGLSDNQETTDSTTEESKESDVPKESNFIAHDQIAGSSSGIKIIISEYSRNPVGPRGDGEEAGPCSSAAPAGARRAEPFKFHADLIGSGEISLEEDMSSTSSDFEERCVAEIAIYPSDQDLNNNHNECNNMDLFYGVDPTAAHKKVDIISPEVVLPEVPGDEEELKKDGTLSANTAFLLDVVRNAMDTTVSIGAAGLLQLGEYRGPPEREQANTSKDSKDEDLMETIISRAVSEESLYSKIAHFVSDNSDDDGGSFDSDDEDGTGTDSGSEQRTHPAAATVPQTSEEARVDDFPEQTSNPTAATVALPCEKERVDDPEQTTDPTGTAVDLPSQEEKDDNFRTMACSPEQGTDPAALSGEEKLVDDLYSFSGAGGDGDTDAMREFVALAVQTRAAKMAVMAGLPDNFNLRAICPTALLATDCSTKHASFSAPTPGTPYSLTVTGVDCPPYEEPPIELQEPVKLRERKLKKPGVCPEPVEPQSRNQKTIGVSQKPVQPQTHKHKKHGIREPVDPQAQKNKKLLELEKPVESQEPVEPSETVEPPEPVEPKERNETQEQQEPPESQEPGCVASGSGSGSSDPKKEPKTNKSKRKRKGKRHRKGRSKNNNSVNATSEPEPKDENKETPSKESKEDSKFTTRCPICSKPALTSCKSCGLAYYCSKDHQREHWDFHKGLCRSYTVSRTPDGHRYLVATRYIPRGTSILSSKPSVVGPDDVYTICLGCCKYVDYRRMSVYQCTHCGFPLCSADCETHPYHEPECKLLSSNGFYLSKDDLRMEWTIVWTEVSHGLRVLRCLLCPEETRKKIHRLLSPEMLNNPLAGRRLTYAIKFIQARLGLTEFPLDEIRAMDAVACVHKTRGGEILNMHVSTLHTSDLALMSNSCLPNTINVECKDEPIKLSVIAAENIFEGQRITTMRTLARNGNYIRFAYSALRAIKCTCKRCGDPTELGLYVNSIYCELCRRRQLKGLLICTDMRNMDTADWMCETCKILIPATIFRQTHDHIMMGVSLMADGDRRDYERYLEEKLWPAGDLHPTHEAIIHVKMKIGLLTPAAQLHTVVNLYREVIKFLQRVDPHGYSVEACRLRMHRGLVQSVLRDVNLKKLSKKDARINLLTVAQDVRAPVMMQLNAVERAHYLRSRCLADREAVTALRLLADCCRAHR